MRQKKAKAIRRRVYGDHVSKAEHNKFTWTNGARIALGLRREYRKAKKEAQHS